MHSSSCHNIFFALISVHSSTRSHFSSILFVLRKIWFQLNLRLSVIYAGLSIVWVEDYNLALSEPLSNISLAQDYTSLCDLLLRVLRDYFTLICSHTGHLDRDHTFIRSKNSSITKQNMYGVSQPNRQRVLNIRHYSTIHFFFSFWPTHFVQIGNEQQLLLRSYPLC